MYLPWYKERVEHRTYEVPTNVMILILLGLRPPSNQLGPPETFENHTQAGDRFERGCRRLRRLHVPSYLDHVGPEAYFNLQPLARLKSTLN